MKKAIALIILISLTEFFCFGEKWYNIKDFFGKDFFDEKNRTGLITIAPIINTSNKGKYCNAFLVCYLKDKEGDFFLFNARFPSDTPHAYMGYIEVKDGSKVSAQVDCHGTQLDFYIRLTLEQYRKEYEGKLVQLQWDNGEYITIQAPIWEEQE